MIKTTTSAAQLNKLVSDVLDSENFNFIKDLKNLQKNFKKFKAKDFDNLLDKMIAKYDSSEAAEAARIRAALIRKAQAGDIKAIELYRDLQKESDGANDEVIIIDTI